MGTAEGTIIIKTNKTIALELEKKYKEDYSDFFRLFCSDDYSEIILDVFIDNFLPATLAIYDLILPYKKDGIVISSMNSETTFNFDTPRDFLFYMYSLWEARILHKYTTMGALIVPTKKSYYNYHRRKLKKYYCKFQ